MRGSGLVIEDTTGDLKVSTVFHHQDPGAHQLTPASAAIFRLVPFSCHVLEIQKAHDSGYFQVVSYYIQLPPKGRTHHRLLCTMQVDDYLSLEASVAQPGEDDYDEVNVSSEHYPATQLY